MRENLRRRISRAALAVVSLVAVVTAGTTSAEQPKFPGREVRFIVPVSPGGGVDTSARMLAKYWEKYLGATIVVENIAGAEYNNAIYALLKSKPDGHTVITLPGVIANQILTGADYDLAKFSWIGRISESVQIAFASKQSGVEKLEDLKKKDVVKAAVTGLSSSQTIGQLISAKMMGFNVRPITHKGSTPMILSVIRGDADWSTNAATATLQYIENKDIVPLWVSAKQRLPQLPNTPTVVELGYPSVLKVTGFHRIVGTRPGVPADIMKKLRDSFEKAVKDPAFVKEYAKLGGEETGYLSGEETAKLVKEQLDLFKPYASYLKSFQ